LKPKRVLFVCIGNSCRSQMAEGLARKLGAGVLEAHSAGSKPQGSVNPTAIEVMRDRGVDISKNASKGLKDVPQAGWDYVITMGCGDACPFVPSKAKADWGIADPHGRPREAFEKAADEIEAKVRTLLDDAQRA